MDKFEIIVKKLKKALNIGTDKELASKLKMSATTFSERKRTNSIPNNEIIELCVTEKLDLNEIYSEKVNTTNIDYKLEIINNLEKLNEQQIKYIYHLTEAEKLKQ
ncbi:helix-turn-helix domain-containing protein [Arcobacter sp. YIC-464]|uniref:helix-turn-helix domain-containing protein n=1 Tax=Arcobacter sp. YIC-464 TaxID=3376631 RepID=UPI003C177C8F